MNREEIEKILKEANEALGNFTDGQLRSHLSIKENRNKSIDKKIEGAKNSGYTNYHNKTGLFARTKEKIIKDAKNANSYLTYEDRAKGGRKAGKLRKDKGKNVLMIDKVTNEIIKEFTSVATAARFLQKRENKIRDVLTNRRKSAYGYFWKFI